MNGRPGGAVGGPTVEVTVAFKGALADGFPGGRATTWVAGGTTVDGLVKGLDLPPSGCIVVVNGAMADRSTPLADGDHVQIHPPMAGG